MDVIAHADGALGKDDECHPLAENEEKERHKVHSTDVLVHWQGCQQDRRVLLAAERGKALSLRQAGYKCHCWQQAGRH